MADPIQWSLSAISDADEPGGAVYTGMRHRDFDSVILLLLADGEPGDTGWYGTEHTSDGRPTRPLLLIYRGKRPAVTKALAWAEKHLQDGSCGLTMPFPTFYEEYRHGSEATRTVSVHLNYPPYPWFTEAQLGMEMGRFFDRVEIVDWVGPTQETPRIYTYRFYLSDTITGDETPVLESDEGDLPF